MKKIWGFIATFFIGFSAGLIAMYKLMGDTVKIEIKKVKNKRVSGEVNTTFNTDIDSPPKRPKRAKSRRNETNS